MAAAKADYVFRDLPVRINADKDAGMGKWMCRIGRDDALVVGALTRTTYYELGELTDSIPVVGYDVVTLQSTFLFEASTLHLECLNAYHT